MSFGAGLIPPAPRARRELVTPVRAGVAAALATAALLWFADVQAVQPPESDLLAQYGYAARLPEGWAHTGGEPSARRVVLTPAAAPRGVELISVERRPLGYDARAEPARAERELVARYHRARRDGVALDRLDQRARFAGRAVISYRQLLPALGAEVDWYVLFDRDNQLSVGCQHTPSGAEPVRAACARVVATVRPLPG